jgi:hypothetical protein
MSINASVGDFSSSTRRDDLLLFQLEFSKDFLCGFKNRKKLSASECNVMNNQQVKPLICLE